MRAYRHENGVVIEELLECGHIVTKYAGDDEPLIAVRRRCAECKEAAGIHEVLPEKKPAQKAIPFPNKEDKSRSETKESPSSRREVPGRGR